MDGKAGFHREARSLLRAGALRLWPSRLTDARHVKTYPKDASARLVRLRGERAELLFEGPLEALLLRADEEAAKDGASLRVEIGGERHELAEIALL